METTSHERVSAARNGNDAAVHNSSEEAQIAVLWAHCEGTEPLHPLTARKAARTEAQRTPTKTLDRRCEGVDGTQLRGLHEDGEGPSSMETDGARIHDPRPSAMRMGPGKARPPPSRSKSCCVMLELAATNDAAR